MAHCHSGGASKTRFRICGANLKQAITIITSVTIQASRGIRLHVRPLVRPTDMPIYGTALDLHTMITDYLLKYMLKNNAYFPIFFYGLYLALVNHVPSSVGYNFISGFPFLFPSVL